MNIVEQGFRSSQHGVTSIEYALLASMIAIAIVAAVRLAGLANKFGWSMEGWLGLVINAIGA